MIKGNAYSALGGVFEYLNNDCGYEQWSQYLINKLAACGVKKGGCGVDMWCGNGYFTRAFKKAGYDVYGVDISPEALTAAVELSRREGLYIQYISGDISTFRTNGKVDFITAINDCINYIPHKKLLSALKRICANLKKGGVFIFDVSSEKKLREKVGTGVFADDGEDATCLWFTETDGEKTVFDVTVFKRRGDGLYERADERQTQYIYGETQILNLLKEAGFSACAEGHLGGGKEDRIVFTAVKL